MIWTAPPIWKGDPAFILGGGPSLRGVDVLALRRRGRTLAINNAGLIEPWADCLYFHDKPWALSRNGRETLAAFRGGLIVTQASIYDFLDPRIRRMKPTSKWPLSSHRQMLAGPDSGSHAINLAFLFGADPIILVGFDMRPGNWHGRYHSPAGQDSYSRFSAHHREMAPWILKEGARVWNCTPGSALTCYPAHDILTVLAELPDWRRPLR